MDFLLFVLYLDNVYHHDLLSSVQDSSIRSLDCTNIRSIRNVIFSVNLVGISINSVKPKLEKTWDAALSRSAIRGSIPYLSIRS